MSSSIAIASGSVAPADNQILYRSIMGFISSSVNTAEANAETPVRDAGIFRNLHVYASANTISGNSVITLRKNLGATALTVTFAADQTGIKEDNTNQVTYAATDKVDIEFNLPNEAGTNNITIPIYGVEFIPTQKTNTVTFLGMYADAGTNVNLSNTSRYFFPITRAAGFTSSEANVKWRVRNTFTASNFAMYVSANARTTDTVFGTRKNGGAGAQSVTYSSGQTGFKEDASNSDSLVAGDDFNFHFTTQPDTATLTFHNLTCRLLSRNNHFALMGGDGAASLFNFGSSGFRPISGHLFGTPTPTEANTRIYPRFRMTAKELATYLVANTINADGTIIALRKNGITAALSVSYAASQTGLKVDSSNQIGLASGDFMNYIISTPGTSGSILLEWVGCLGRAVSSIIPT